MTPAPLRLTDDRSNNCSRRGESNLSRLDALWFEPGTAADAAAAMNLHRAPIKHLSAERVRRYWALSQKLGRLPPFERPSNGFPPGPLAIIKEFVALYGRAA